VISVDEDKSIKSTDRVVVKKSIDPTSVTRLRPQLQPGHDEGDQQAILPDTSEDNKKE
jgi:hypothetical protein